MVLDAYSKLLEVVKMKSTTSAMAIRVLRQMFSRHGLPEIIVSDNGPQFTSQDFKEFCDQNGIVHRTCAVHKPATNGKAERVVQILKSAIKIANLQKQDVDTVLANYLLMYRVTPHITTGESPSM